MNLTFFVFLLLSVRGSITSKRTGLFITLEKDPLLYKHIIKAFLPIFGANGTKVMQHFLSKANLLFPESVPFELFSSKLVDDKIQLNRFSLDESMFENLYVILQAISFSGSMEMVLKGADDVIEEACRISCRVLDVCTKPDDPWATAVDGYVFTVANIYLNIKPNARVAPWLLKYLDKYISLKASSTFTTLPILRTTGLDVFEVMRGKEFSRMYTLKRNSEQRETKLLYLLCLTRLDTLRDEFIGPDPSVSTIIKSNYLDMSTQLPNALKAAFDVRIMLTKKSQKQHEFVFDSFSTTPAPSVYTYFTKKLHLEHSGVEQLYALYSYTTFSHFLQNALECLMKIDKSVAKEYALTYGIMYAQQVDESIAKHEELRRMLRGQAAIYMLAMGLHRMPRFKVNSVEEYMRVLPVWLREVRARVDEDIRHSAFCHLKEELSFCADLLRYDSKKKADLISSSISILKS